MVALLTLGSLAMQMSVLATNPVAEYRACPSPPCTVGQAPQYQGWSQPGSCYSMMVTTPAIALHLDDNVINTNCTKGYVVDYSTLGSTVFNDAFTYGWRLKANLKVVTGNLAVPDTVPGSTGFWVRSMNPSGPAQAKDLQLYFGTHNGFSNDLVVSSGSVEIAILEDYINRFFDVEIVYNPSTEKYRVFLDGQYLGNQEWGLSPDDNLLWGFLAFGALSDTGFGESYWTNVRWDNYPYDISVQIAGPTVNCPHATCELTAIIPPGVSGTYVWKRDGVTISNGSRYSGATTSVLSIADIAMEQMGFYTCEVTVGGTTYVSDAREVKVCLADYNCDHQIDMFDYDDFVEDFENSGSRADINGDDFLDFFDYDDYVEIFEAGC